MEFTATDYATVAEKEAFFKHFKRFVENDFPQGLWTKKFYNRLIHVFGHIAHYDQLGFWDVWFSSDETKLAFLKNALHAQVYGEPDYTWCDVERAIQTWLHSDMSMILRYCERITTTTEQNERAELARLKEKYEKVA